MSSGAIAGVSDHGGWAVIVTVADDAKLLDRRRVELVDDDLPGLPHHHDGQMLPIEEAVVLVERVRLSAERQAKIALDALAADVPGICGIALRECPELPATIAERITDYRARNLADWIMYRKALAAAAETRGWRVRWFDPKRIPKKAADALRVTSFEDYFRAMRASAGPPWNKDHALAMAAAIAASGATS